MSFSVQNKLAVATNNDTADTKNGGPPAYDVAAETARPSYVLSGESEDHGTKVIDEKRQDPAGGHAQVLADDAHQNDPAQLDLDERVRIAVSRGGLSILSSLRKMQTELNKNPQWQAAKASVSNVATKVGEAPPVAAARRIAPMPPGAITNSSTSAKTAGVAVIGSLAKNAQHPTVAQKEQRLAGKKEETKQLQTELERLKEANRLKAEERKRQKSERAKAREGAM